jgi:hypothetical protein
MTDVTHLIYAALYEKPSLLQSWSERDQMETDAETLFEPLNAAANLQHVSLLRGTKAYGVHLGPMRIPACERDPRHRHANFYWLQEDYLRAEQAGRRWRWTTLSPRLVVGEAIARNLNIIPACGDSPLSERKLDFRWHFPKVHRLFSKKLIPACSRASLRQRNFQYHQRRRLRMGRSLAGCCRCPRD